MSKSSGTPNTLFKYFSKSPAVLLKSGSEVKSKNPHSPGKVKRPENDESPINTTKRVKREESSEKKGCSDPEDEEIKFKQKRRRILQDSGSEEDEEVTTIKKDRKENKENGSDNTNIKQENTSFLEKLQSMKSESTSTSVKKDIEVNEPAKPIDEPEIWPHNKLEFLKPEKIKDKKGRRPDHPDYDPTTLYVPEKFLNSLTPGVRQWWELKSEHFDCVLFFKVGKFYEFYHMDADIGVKELGFTYMRGEFAHSGFPEVSYDRMSSTLIERGYKVARVEQTETPDMMTERCKKQKQVTKFDRVVKREICQITNKGTKVYGAQSQIGYNHQPNYMLAVVEHIEKSNSIYGVCFVDTSIGDFYIGQFKDDKSCSRLLTLLSHNPPVLVLHHKTGTSAKTQQVFRTALSNVIKECLVMDSQFWKAEKTLRYLRENFFLQGEDCKWPTDLKLMQNPNDHLGITPNKDFEVGLQAFGGCIWYLKKCLLENQVLSMARFHVYTPPDMLNDSLAIDDLTETVKKEINKKSNRNSTMVLDSITLQNLRITGEEHSLLSSLDQCCTKFGKRLLHYWVCSPSCDINIIKDRQDAISDFINNPNVTQEFRSLINMLPDLERLLAQIHGFGNGARLKDHPDGRAILFEEKTYNKKKIQNFIAILKGFESLTKIPQLFKSFESSLVKHLSQNDPEGVFPEMEERLKFFENAFDHEEALKEGVIAPEKGVDKEYDAVEEEIAEINEELKQYLISQEKFFGCRINYFGSDKKRFQLEVPESYARKADSDYILEGQKKGTKPVRRFHTEETKDFLKRMMQAEEQRNTVLKDLSRRIFEKFSKHYDLWKQCVDSVANLDVLASLAEYTKSQNKICIPEVVDNVELPFIELEDGYHPCIESSDSYIPNGIKLGGPNNAPLALLTGPNMGGKSTLMRQVGLLAVMAQIGCHIPAESCRMSVIDRIFTRLGAQDDILAGHSTFLVELNETSSILKHTTVDSLVLLDELGRGTATYDGTAIAASVVHFLAELKCRTLFSTHYHNLVDYFQRDQRISLGHMACMVENEDSEDPTQETVTFLYKYTSGACPKSYGFNAAKLAGMPHSIIKRSYELSKKVEAAALKRKIISKILGNSDDITSIKDLISKIETCKVK